MPGGRAAANRGPMEAAADIAARSAAGKPLAMTAPSHNIYVLSGPVSRADPRVVPMRGDLAHIGLAGRYFAPHYAVPQPRIVMPGGARLLTVPDAAGEELCTLMEGDSFEVLDVTGNWAWGCLSLDGPTGYVAIDRLEALA